jgi:hypothetical protein
VRSAAPELLARSFGRYFENDGSIRCPAAGSDESDAADRMVMSAVPFFARSLMGPSKTPLGSTRIVSPGCAASIAACRLAPALTVIVAAAAPRTHSRAAARDRPITTPNFFTYAPVGSGET